MLMYELRMLLLSALMLLSFSGFQAMPSSDTVAEEHYDGMVILQIDGLTDAIHAKMQEVVSARMDVGIEYVCVESGIAVIVFSNSNMAEKGDNEMMVRNYFKGCTPAGSMKTVFVDVRQQAGTSKC